MFQIDRGVRLNIPWNRMIRKALIRKAAKDQGLSIEAPRYIYMCVCVCVCVYMNIYIYVYICVCVPICMYIYIYVCV